MGLIIFDYCHLDTETRILVKQRSSEIKTLMKRTAQSIIEIGEKLIEVKNHLPHGAFGEWLEIEFEWGTSQAARFMQVAERFGGDQIYQIDKFAPSALYLLAAPGTPDEARSEALSRAEAGERITHQAAKQIVSDHKPSPATFASDSPLMVSGYTVPRHCGLCGHMQSIQMDKNKQPIVQACEACGEQHSDWLYNAPKEVDARPGIGPVTHSEDGSVSTVTVTNGDVAGGLAAVMEAEAPARPQPVIVLRCDYQLLDQAGQLNDPMLFERGKTKGVVQLPNGLTAVPFGSVSQNLKYQSVDLIQCVPESEFLWQWAKHDDYKSGIEKHWYGFRVTDRSGKTWVLTGQEIQLIPEPPDKPLDHWTKLEHGYAVYPCHVCEEKKIQIDPVGNSVRCEACGNTWDTIGDYHEERERWVVTNDPIIRQADDAVPNSMAVHHSSKSVEHYTPPEIVDAVIEVMGAITLDPCSNSKTDPNVRAAIHFTAQDDGLSQAWFGNVYMNPPYGREIGEWVAKLTSEHSEGEVREAIALVPARPDTQWWKQLRDYPCCFVEGRLQFIGNDDPAPFPSAVFYLGTEIGRFYRVFSQFGDIWQRIEPGMFGE